MQGTKKVARSQHGVEQVQIPQNQCIIELHIHNPHQTCEKDDSDIDEKNHAYA